MLGETFGPRKLMGLLLVMALLSAGEHRQSQRPAVFESRNA
jgi:hypothetical protein